MVKLTTPGKDAIEQMPLFERLELAQIELIRSGVQASAAVRALLQEQAWGFDTESKPTFVRDEKSDGPHVVQLSSLSRAWVFQLIDPDCCAQVALLLNAPNIVKAGFGLRDDKKHILRKLGIEVNGLVDLNVEFNQRGYRKEVGVKDAIATLYQQRFIKSKKVATSNWANAQLSDAQLVYAANDAFAARWVYQRLLETRTEALPPTATSSYSKRETAVPSRLT